MEPEALVRAIDALETIEPTGPSERAITWLQLQTYRRRLRAIVGIGPAWQAEEILSANQRIDDDRPVVWLSETRTSAIVRRK